jgi:hypothetical protein
MLMTAGSALPAPVASRNSFDVRGSVSVAARIASRSSAYDSSVSPNVLSRRALRAAGSGTARNARCAVSAGRRWSDWRIDGSRTTSSLRNAAAVSFFVRAWRESGALGCAL